MDLIGCGSLNETGPTWVPRLTTANSGVALAVCRHDLRVGSGKAAANLEKHGVSFEEAASVFLDPKALTFSDPDDSDQEEREMTIGRLARRRVLFIAHCERDDRIRIISARKVTRGERRQYEEGIGEAAR